MSRPTSGFRHGGHDEYSEVLDREMKARLDPLFEKLRGETDPALRKRLKDEILEIKKEFGEKKKSMKRSLFNRS